MLKKKLLLPIHVKYCCMPYFDSHLCLMAPFDVITKNGSVLLLFQATQYKGVLYMAGQLGLDPPTMDLCVGGPTVELEQALQNSEAVAACFNASIFTSTFLFVIYCSARLTSSEKTQVQEKLKSSFSSSDGPAFLYVLASDLPKG